MGMTFSFLAIALVASMAVANLVAGKIDVGAVLGVLTVGYLVAVGLYMRRRPVVGANLGMILCTLGIEYSTYAKGGVIGSPLAWYPPMLLIVILLLPMRWTAFWFVVWIALRAVVAVYGVPDSYDAELLGPPWLHALSTAGALTAVYTMGSLYQATLTMAERVASTRADEAAAASQAKSLFLANMSHEIRTPMNGVLGLVDVLLSEERDPEEQREMLRTVQRSGFALMAILDDVLDLSRIEAGAMVIEDGVVGVSEIVSDVHSLFRDGAETRAIALVCAVEPDVPRQVRGDGLRTRQILSNLVGNAIKFTSEGCVSLKVRQVDGFLHYVVEDTGPGIAPERLQQVFGAFQQEDSSTTRRFGGSGLGLAISRQLAELMGGRLWLESRVGHGTRAILELPARPCEGPVGSESAVGQVSLEGGRVLVAEDNPVNRTVIEAMLRRFGLDVRVVVDGRAAVEALEEGDLPDLVLMDCHMPVMDGFDAARALREAHGEALPILALTASVMDDDRRRCAEAGMDEMITKPIRSDALKIVLARYLGRTTRPAA